MAHPQGNRKGEGVSNDKEEGGKAVKAQLAVIGSPKAVALDRKDSLDDDDDSKTPFPILCISRLDPQRVIVPASALLSPCPSMGYIPIVKARIW